MSDYTPKPGDRVHLTVEAVVDEHGNYQVDHRTNCGVADGLDFPDFGTTHWVWPSMACLVRVEPAPVELPTGFGARIRATVTWAHDVTPGVRLVFSDVDVGSGDWTVHPADRARVGCFTVFASNLSDIEILDPGEPPA